MTARQLINKLKTIRPTRRERDVQVYVYLCKEGDDLSIRQMNQYIKIDKIDSDGHLIITLPS